MMPHCNTIARHAAITVWERLWPDGNPEKNYMKALETTTAKAFERHTGEDLKPGVMTLAHDPVYDDTAPKPLIVTIHAWWNRFREGRQFLTEQSVNEWLYMLDTAFADAVVEVIMVGAWTREDRYENLEAMPIYELAGLPDADNQAFPLLERLTSTLAERGTLFVGELIRCTADELSAVPPRLIPYEIAFLRRKLSEYGLALKGEHPIPELVPAEL